MVKESTNNLCKQLAQRHKWQEKEGNQGAIDFVNSQSDFSLSVFDVGFILFPVKDGELTCDDKGAVFKRFANHELLDSAFHCPKTVWRLVWHFNQ